MSAWITENPACTAGYDETSMLLKRREAWHQTGSPGREVPECDCPDLDDLAVAYRRRLGDNAAMTRLVFSTNPDDNRRCDACGELVSECTCKAAASTDPAAFTAKIRIETAGRGGKTVTVIDELPPNAEYLKDLARKLKTGCGCGGTHEIVSGRGVVEIQGDKRPRVREILQKNGVRFKG